MFLQQNSTQTSNNADSNEGLPLAAILSITFSFYILLLLAGKIYSVFCTCNMLHQHPFSYVAFLDCCHSQLLFLFYLVCKSSLSSEQFFV